jgi:hypothetical protein
VRGLIVIIFSVCLAYGQTPSPIIITEIMFNTSGNNEFVELYNLSTSESISLKDWKIKYYTSTADGIIGLDTNLILQPQSYAIILEADYDYSNGIYNQLIPAGALLLKIDNNSFGASGMANTTDRTIYLLNESNDTVDVYTYSADNNAGYSDEKINLNNDNSTSNWKNSLTLNGSPGFRNTVSRKLYDLQLSSLTIKPVKPIQNENIEIEAIVKNTGAETSDNFEVLIYNDINFDSLITGDEEIYNQKINALISGDSISVQTSLTYLNPGSYNLIAVVNYVADEDTANNIRFLRFTVYPPPNNFNDVVINEIMYAPLTGQAEWIELYNKTSVPVNLNGWKIYDNSSHSNVASETKYIPPNGFVILCKDTLIKNYFNVPSEIIISRLPSFNNTGDVVCIRDSTGLTIDSLEYLPTWGGSAGGKSLERISAGNESTDETNWASSVSKFKATPGKVNSVTPKNFDIGISDFRNKTGYGIIGQQITIQVKVKNYGINAVESFIINFYSDLNADSIIQANEYFGLLEGNSLSAKDSIIMIFTTGNFEAGKNYFIAKIITDKDEEEENNISFTSFNGVVLNETRNDLVINEIMYAPTSPEPEWVEIFNRSSKIINISGYRIADNADTISVITKTISLAPQNYFIIAKDSSVLSFYDVKSGIFISSFPSLNNTADKIILLDSLDRVIDSLEYFTNWGGSGGRSLERISSEMNSALQENWGTSISTERATPGRENSVTVKTYDLAISEFKASEKYGITGKPIKLTATIKNTGLTDYSYFQLYLYNDVNSDSVASQDELIKTETAGSFNAGDSISFNFSVDELKQGKNYFILIIDAADYKDSTNNISFTQIQVVQLNEERNDVVINEIMFAPSTGEPEWIELYNRSNKSIELKNYFIADAADTIRVNDKTLLFSPHTFIVIAKDSSINSIYKVNSTIIISNFPSLNNSTDKLILLDSLERVIDSLSYSSKWGGTNGKSLERISADSSSIDSSNWKSCVYKEHGSPGKINSVSQKNNDVAMKEISFTPAEPIIGESVSITALIKNIGKQSAEFNLLLYEDDDLDSLADKNIETTPSYHLPSGDSLLFTFNYVLENIKSETAFAVKIFSIADEDTSNNCFWKSISPGYNASSVLVNEIMYTPVNGEPEWIELYNNSQDTIDLKDWTVNDIITTPVTVKISKQKLSIPPKKFLVISKDSTIALFHRKIESGIVIVNLPVLNNDEDGVVIKDSRRVTIDSVHYFKSYGGQSGSSLERVSVESNSGLSSNWKSSKDLEMSTPGRINSLTPKKYDLSFAAISSDPEFPVAGDNVKLKVKVANNGINSAGNFKINFYFKYDSLAAFQYLDELTGLSIAAADTEWFASTASIMNLQSALYVKAEIFLQADEDTLNNIGQNTILIGSSKNVLLINEIMYDPYKNESEWFELVNTSDETLNLKNWRAGDLSLAEDLPVITKNDFYLNPREYLVCAKDSSFNFGIQTDKIICFNFGSLGNSEDGIIIHDFRDAPIDSIKYTSKWGGRKGFSIERISLLHETNDSANWVTSICKNGCTAGYANSVSQLVGYERNSLVINELMYEPGSSNSEFIEFYNLNSDSVDVGGWKIYKSNGDYFEISETSLCILKNEYFVCTGDSAIYDNYSWLKNSKVVVQPSLGLTNSDDILILKDAKGNTVDSIYYSTKWHNRNIVETKNKSLERINPGININDPDNWSTAVNAEGGTPGKENSIFTSNQKLEEKISVSPNPFSPDNDGFEDFAIINYNLKQLTAQVRIKIYDSQGRLVRTLLNNQASGSKGSVVFDGLSDGGHPLRIGIYIIFLEAMNDNSGVLETMKTVVVVARKL